VVDGGADSVASDANQIPIHNTTDNEVEGASNTCTPTTTTSTNKVEGDGLECVTSDAEQTIAQDGIQDLAAHVRKNKNGAQSFNLRWILDSGAAVDIIPATTVAKKRVQTDPFEGRCFSGVGGTVQADQVCRGINLQELGVQVAP
jgi:hypothetical protein